MDTPTFHAAVMYALMAVIAFAVAALIMGMSLLTGMSRRANANKPQN